MSRVPDVPRSNDPNASPGDTTDRGQRFGDDTTSDTLVKQVRPASDDATSDTLVPWLPEEREPGTAAVRRHPSVPDDRIELLPVDRAYYARGPEIARGGMGRVLSARDLRLGRPVAIKELLVDTPDLRMRFEREARITARLQHPAIVSVIEAGVWPAGEPFYVMRYVTGETFDALIRARTTLRERLALLPNLIAAVDALAYAHNMRVVHRDLKPANVLLGAFGETVVVDWGLAKDLSAPEADVESEPPLPRPRKLSGSADTLAGSVLGTPAYMPPEQARGEPVDERADVYALGAMLYHLLTGVPPYSAPSPTQVLASVLAGPPAAMRSRERSIREDLVAIVETAMAREPADRYPSAKELAEDLKRFQTGQLVGAHAYSLRERIGRWARRHRTAVRVGGVAVLLLGIVSIVSVRRVMRERARAEAARVEAARNRGQAEELLGFMLEDLSEKLRALGKLELLDSVTKRALRHYSVRTDELSYEDRRRQAVGMTTLARVLRLRGDLTGALKLERDVLAMAERLATESPDDALARHAVSTTHLQIGIVIERQGDIAGARAEYERAIAVDEELLARDPRNAMWLHSVAQLRSTLAQFLLFHGDLSSAAESIGIEMKLAERLVAVAPGSAAADSDLEIAHQDRGLLLERQGDLSGALAAYRTFLEMSERRAAAAPTDMGLQGDLSIARFKVGDAWRKRGELDKALDAYRASDEIAQHLAALDPTNMSLRRDVVTTEERIALTLLTKGQVDAALDQYRGLIRTVEPLATKDPTNTVWQRDHAEIRISAADALYEKRRFVEALVEVRLGAAIIDALVAKSPADRSLRRDSAECRNKLGRLLLALHDRPGALVAQRASLALASQLVLEDPSNPEWQRAVAEARAGIGKVLVDEKDVAGGRASFGSALQIYERLLTTAPDKTADVERASELRRLMDR